MGDKTFSKIVAVFVVILFLGMIASSAFQGGDEKPDFSVKNYGLVEYSEEDGEAVLYLKIKNNLPEQNKAGITLKLNDEVINSTEVDFSSNQTKELTFDVDFRFRADDLLFTVEDRNGETVGTVDRAIANYPTIP